MMPPIRTALSPTSERLDELIEHLDDIGVGLKDDPGDVLAAFIGNDAVRGAYHRAQTRLRNSKKGKR